MNKHMGPQTAGQAHPNPAPSNLPADLAAVALIDAKTCAAPGSMSVSWWHEKVANGEAPQPAIRMPRCTRWRVKDVADFWREFAGQADSESAAKLKAQAGKASAAAQAKRRAQSTPVGA
jgi:hypothetical protein